MKFPIKTIIGITGIGFAILWSVNGVRFDELVRSFKGIDTIQAVAVLFLTSCNLMIRAIVWKKVVGALKPVSMINALSSYLVGVFSNLFLPFKLGDLAQGYALGKRQHINTVSVVSAVIIQRVFEISSLVIIMMTVVMLFSVPFDFKTRTLFLGLLVVSTVVTLVLMYKYRKGIMLIIEKILVKFSPGLSRSVGTLFDHFIHGTIAINNVSGALSILLLSVISWIVQIIMVKITANALDIHIDLIASSVVLMIINIGLMIPITPGNIGSFQFFGIIALSLFSVTKSKALAFAIIFQVIQGIPVILGGLISMIHLYRHHV